MAPKKKHENSFLGRVLIFFRPLWLKIKEKRIFRSVFERQKALACYTGAEGSEESKLSYGFGFARVISAILLVLLLVVTLLFGSGAVSYEKVYYMFKDISYVKSFGESTTSTLSYSRPVQNQVFESFKGGLAVASDSEIKTFTSTGRVTLSQGSEFTNPRLSASDGYLFAYDQGSYSYSIYNSFICVKREKLDFPISYADMADNGSFLVVTASEKYDSLVKIYDSNFEEITQYSRNDTVISASLSSNGRYAAVLSLSAENGESIVTLSVIDSKKNEILSSTNFNGYMPYRCDFLSDDRIAVILDGKVSLIDRDGRVKGEYVYPSNLEKLDVRDGRIAMVFAESDSYDGKKAVIVDAEGNMLFAKSIKGNVRDLKIGDGALYILQSGKVIRFNTLLGTESFCTASDASEALVVFSDGKIVLCTQTDASYISFD